jgi:hypothetical protein
MSPTPFKELSTALPAFAIRAHTYNWPLQDTMNSISLACHLKCFVNREKLHPCLPWYIVTFFCCQVLPSILQGLRKAAAAKDAAAATTATAAGGPAKAQKGPRPPPERTLPSRQARKAAEEEIKKTSASGTAAAQAAAAAAAAESAAVAALATAGAGEL